MRLLNVYTLRLEEFNESKAPPYAILSHTWGEGEVSFDDIQDTSGKYTNKAGYEKIHKTCEQAINDEFNYVWIDTCCIDKSSSAELSESINSMFRCHWFTRGWTPQELLALRKVKFFGSDWSLFGNRAELREEISKATGIDRMVLCNGEVSNPNAFGHGDGEQLPSLSIDKAKSTRLEDMAYCLFGLFDVNMPLIYGESQKAFVRRQEEIMKRYNDHSIFAWNIQTQSGSVNESESNVSGIGVLAHFTSCFQRLRIYYILSIL
ncbi:hypothetical protein BDV38DRAFT_271156 [Aspergillus pseudotamarii]|uniref:Uncharacterized protein n=1 Tax=Aspergillus pseudotamarii TaxID=132259 RepID=A0A5N6SSB0_ASPPS|nr:uncharacterized protein BDV38DRAFT_271156 [Aspergillus pseudotamarii]KAE8137558.1 hypothetical protein BDV38DRAFT_271156 [Aspergillus pseudotamarii]